MPGGLTLTNPLTHAVAAAVGKSQFSVNVAGESLSTGKKANNDVVSAFLGSSLNDNVIVLNQINGNINYSIAALDTAENSLKNIANTLTEMLGVVAQATGNSDVNRATLNNILQQKQQQVGLQTESAEFDNRKLLMGDLGADPTIASNFDTKAVSVKSRSSAAAKIAGAGTIGVNTLTVGAAAAGELVRLGNQEFKAVSGAPAAEGEFKIGSTVQETARNLATAMLNSTNEQTKNYTFTVSGADVVISQITASATAIPVNGSANIANVVTTAGTADGIDLSNIRDVAEFINSPVANVQLVSQVTSAGGDNAAKILGTQFDNAAAIAANSADGDAAAIYKVTIGGKEFTGAMFEANGGNLNNAVMVMSHADTNESFTLTFDAAYAGNVTAGNAGAVATDIANFLSESRFNQTRSIELNVDHGDIYDPADGTVVASTNGLTASLTSTDFANKKFTDFKIEDAGAGNVKITAFVENPAGLKQEFTVTRTAGAQIDAMVQGFKLDLTDAITGDVLSLNLGEEGLTSLAQVKYHKLVEDAFKDSLLKTGSGLEVRVGKGFEDVLNVNISNISFDKLFTNNLGNYVPALSILNDTDAKVAQEVLEGALVKIRSEEASVQTQIESIREASAALESTIAITQQSANSYTDADLLEYSQMFSDGIKRIVAAISAMQAGNKISDAAQQLLQGL